MLNGFSLLIPVYAGDDEKFLDQALTSVLNSTKLPAEIVLVVDGEIRTNLLRKIKHFEEKYDILRVIFEKQNFGLGYILSRGLNVCKCRYVARLDADDIVHTERFQKQYEFLEKNPHVDIVGTFARRIDENAVELNLINLPIDHFKIAKSLWANPMIHPSVMFRRDAILSIGNYNPMLRRRQDYELWFRAERAGLVLHNLPDALLYYRTVGDRFARIDTAQAWNQGMIGFNQLRKSSGKLPLYFFVFYPYIRSLFPAKFQFVLHKLFKFFDPR